MLVKKEYERLLKKRIIEDYIKENHRSPTVATIREKEIEYRAKYPNLDLVGFSTIDVKHPNFLDKSSSAVENKNRKAMSDDSVAVSNRIDILAEKMFDSFTGFATTTHRSNRLIQSIEARLDNLILLNSKADIFLYGIQEDFSTSEFVDQERSTVSIEPGYVTLGKDTAEVIDLNEVKLSFTSNSKKGVISASSVANINSLKKKDGIVWEYYVYTSYKTGEVSCIIEADFGEGEFISEVKLAGNAVNTNSRMKFSVLYSKDGSTYTMLGEDQYFVTGINSKSVGQEDVKKIQIILTKYTADDVSSINDHKYIFSLDSLEFTADKFSRNSESVLYAGPYEIYDEVNRPVNFTQATMKDGTCCIIPDKTNVSFFLSNDNVSWIPASYSGDSFSTVKFSNSNPAGSYEYIDEIKNPYSLITEAPDRVNLQYSEEALCNLRIPADWSDKLVLQNTIVERNLPQNGKKLYQTESGWFYDSANQTYSTVIHIDSVEGRRIDLGPRGAEVNGQLMSGNINLPQGYHTFKTSHMNWHSVDRNLTTVELLENADPIYPFNHKLIVEGYPYSSDFSGERVYNALGRNFGVLMRYVTPELFNSGELDGDLTVYTIEEYDDVLYFKVKIDPGDSSYASEHIKVSYMIKNGGSNKIWVKAIIKSNDTNISPHINTFQVRVV